MSQPEVPASSCVFSRRSSKKREAILKAAFTLFCQDGYPRTSMDAVAALAGVSKATVYAHFPSKHALFTEILRSYTEPYIKLSASIPDLSPEEGMRVIATNFIRMVTSPEALTTYRTVMTQGAEFPEMVEAFFAAGPYPVIATVAEYFEGLDRRGVLSVPNPRLAAVIFLHAIKGEAHGHALANSPRNFDNDEVIDEIIRMFLAAYRRKDGD